MINSQRVEAILKEHYPDLECVSDGVFRGIDRFGLRDYAIRYFDLNDQLTNTAISLKSYQEEVLSQMYFSSEVATDLRWNHYLYFITSEEEAQRAEFSRLKAKVEADREYARKQVVLEGEISRLLANAQIPELGRAMPVDLATQWSNTLDQHGLGYILDSHITVPDAVRRIVAGATDEAARPLSPMPLLESERLAANRFISRLTINGFRPHPELKEHQLGRVNLIVGNNGVGKTSLLEAIEFAYCGNNRRSSPLLNSTSITLDLAGIEEKLSSTTDAARLRARHSNWYAKTELRTVTVHDSFGKFNFLDTDAAVNLSVAGSSEQIGTDVTRLVLGAAAENLADRLRRVLKQLQDELKDLRRDKSACEDLAAAAKSRLKVIKASPKLSDSLFLELLESIKAVGWLQLPIHKSQLDTLRESLQRAISAIALIQHSSNNMLQYDPDSALLLLASLNEEAIMAETLDYRAKESRLALTNAHREAETTAAMKIVTETLFPYAHTEFSKLIKQKSELQYSVYASKARLDQVANVVDVNDIRQFFDNSIADAIALVSSNTEMYQQKIDAARSLLQTLEKTQSAMTVLRQRLLATAQDILQRVQNPDHCPLCKTEFEDGQLLARMMLNIESGTSDQASILQLEISSTNDALVNARAMLATLKSVDAFVGEGTRIVTVEKVFQQIEEMRAALERDQSDLESLQMLIQQHGADGLSSEDLSRRLLAAGMVELPALDELQRIQASFDERLETLQKAAQIAIRESGEVKRERDALAERLSIQVFSDTDDLVKMVRKQVSDIETALGARRNLELIMKISDKTTAEEITLNLSVIQNLLAQVATAVSQEGANDIALNNEEKNIAHLAGKIEDYDTKIRRASGVEQVLLELAEQSLGGELEKQILVENAAEIARIFASIHMPNEFEINAPNGSLSIIRRTTGDKIELSQMSTGQRAAFALSLFLAMNGRLRSGPPILLFDDPIAHVDDINMLSFLDHLRSLAINENRQIFFATADNKLAGLFRHKFRFLGNEFKELCLSRSS